MYSALFMLFLMFMRFVFNLKLVYRPEMELSFSSCFMKEQEINSADHHSRPD